MAARRALTIATPVFAVAVIGVGAIWFPSSSTVRPATSSIAAQPVAVTHPVTSTAAPELADAAVPGDLARARAEVRVVATGLRRTSRIVSRATTDGTISIDEADAVLGSIDDADQQIATTLTTIDELAQVPTLDRRDVAALTTMLGHVGACGDAIAALERAVESEVPPTVAAVEPLIGEIRALADETARIVRSL